MKLLISFCCFFALKQVVAQVEVYDVMTNLAIADAVIRFEGQEPAHTNAVGIFPVSADLIGHRFTVEAKGHEAFSDTLRNRKTIVYLVPVANSLEEFVITGQLSATTADQSVQKIRVIDRKAIDAKGAVNLRDMLQTELNIRINQDQMLGSGLSLQGLSGQNVKILLDGVPVIGRQDGEIDLSQINLANIERIEIIEGPSSVKYGSDALAGTINLISRKQAAKGIKVTATAYYESIGNYNTDLSLSSKLGPGTVQIYGQRNYFGGWSASDPFFSLPQSKVADSGRFQSWKPKLQYQAGINYSFRVKRMQFRPYAEYFQELIYNKGLPRAPYYATAFDDYYNTRRSNAGINFDIPIGKQLKFSGVAAYNLYTRVKNTYVKNLNTLEQNLSATVSDQDTSGFTALMSRGTVTRITTTKRLNFEAGYDINYESGSGQRILGNRQVIAETAVFGNVEYRAKWLTVRPGARLTSNSRFGFAATPALNFRAALKQWSFRGGVSSGFRSPSIKELYMDFVDINHNIHGNTNLKPEESMHYQVWISRKNKKTGGISFDANAYYQHIRNRISLAMASDGVTYSYFNLDETDILGSQGIAELRVKKHYFKAGTGYVGTRSNLTTSKYSFSSEVTANALLDFGVIRFGAFYKYTGKAVTYTQAEDGSIQASRMKDYSLLDLSASRDFFKKKLTVTLGGKNILNVRQVGTSGTTATVHSSSTTSVPVGCGTSVYIKLQINLQTNGK